MMKKLLLDKKGSVLLPAALLVIVVSLLIGIVLLFATTEIQMVNIRNAVKTELANMSIRISEDTYKALREGNFTAYRNKLYSSVSYKKKLINQFMSDLQAEIPFSTDEYTMSNIKLEFTRDSNRLIYTFTCDLQFDIVFVGEIFPPLKRNIAIESSHSAKY